jgi:hypothetical protein
VEEIPVPNRCEGWRWVGRGDHPPAVKLMENPEGGSAPSELVKEIAAVHGF